MALIKRLFSKSKKSGQENDSLPFSDDKISLDLLKQLIPVRNLSDDELIAFSLKKKPETFPAGSTLFRQGDDDGSVLYLLDGIVETDTDGQKHQVASNTPEARFPLSRTRRHCATAYAQTDVQVLRVSNKIMGQERQNTEIDFHGFPENLPHSQLLQAFWQACQDDEINPPIQPQTTEAIKRKLENNCDASQLGDIAMLDPVIAAKLIQIANSPLYVPALPMSSCSGAANRLGSKATRHLFLRLVTHHQFNSLNLEIAERMDAVWENSRLVSQLCALLAEDTNRVNPEGARLAGLLCDIGCLALLQFADNFPDEYYSLEELDQTIPFVRGVVGNQILANWGLPEQLTSVPDYAENWYYNSGPSLKLIDIVILSKYISYMETKMAELPILSDLPAFNKLPPGLLSEEHLSQLMHRAKQQLTQMLTPRQ